MAPNVPVPLPNALLHHPLPPGTDPLTIEGPFATEQEATDNAAADKAAFPQIPVMVDVLVNPANC